jgi:hypothetical protein
MPEEEQLDKEVQRGTVDEPDVDTDTSDDKGEDDDAD